MVTNCLRLYARGRRSIWTDRYIAKNMLAAHLDPEGDGASRNLRTVERTVDWIDSVSEGRRRLLDLGCGPGLYAHAFAGRGYTVTGIDISASSIRYARAWARREREEISYRRADYLRRPARGKFELATCIYCDFGALVPGEQARFLGNLKGALEKGGLFIFDVFGAGLSATRKEGRVWSFAAEADFWSPRPHYLLEESVHFPEARAWGTRTIVMEAGRLLKEYLSWDQYYDEEGIARLLGAGGFAVEAVERGLVGKNAFTSEDVLFLKARRV
jgi:SAM-dependent methyltransferase